MGKEMKRSMTYIILIASLFSMSLYASGEAPIGASQSYYTDLDCDWKAGQPEYTYCSQDWMLFVFWPLECETVCEFTNFCIGLFPGSETTEEYDLDNTFCTRFLVTGQLGWLFDATGSVTYDQAGVTVDFLWYHGNTFSFANTLIVPQTGQGFGPLQYTLSQPILLPQPNGGQHWFKVCVDKVTIDGGFNGDATGTINMQFIYST